MTIMMVRAVITEVVGVIPLTGKAAPLSFCLPQ